MTRSLILTRMGATPEPGLAELPLREPGPGELRITIDAAALNPLDAKLARGHLADWFPIALPWVPGTDFAGRVVAVGAGVTGFTAGDEVFGRSDPVAGGAFGPAITLPAGFVARRPAGIDAATAAALVTPAAIALQALDEVAGADDPLVILGSGAVGTALVQIARRGRAVTVSGRHAARLAAPGVQVLAAEGADLAAAIAGAGVVIDTVGGPGQRQVLARLRPGARFLAIAEPLPEDAAVPAGVKAGFAALAGGGGQLDRIAGLAADGVLVPEIANRFGIGDAAVVFSAWTAGRLPARQVMVREG
ncbi:alcohol dehydrogenase catalytic domain-containing protein [Tistrella mobilis]|uniref:alcohol dehydrogenase catalytic domain-containing protein n=1 Tax=Tistrella mobilis TaxID=171437 RepID=UPI003558A923